MSSIITSKLLACALFTGVGALSIAVAHAAQPSASASPAAAEQMAVLPLDYTQLTTWTASDVSHGENLSYEAGGDFSTHQVIQDLSTNRRWEYHADRNVLFDMLTKLHAVSAENLTQLGYVGSMPNSGGVQHGAWIVPLTSGKTPSALPPGLDVSNAKAFSASTLSVKWSPEAHEYVLTDGNQIIAQMANGADSAPLGTLQQMIESYGANAVMEIPSQDAQASTPVGSQGPISVFLKISASEPVRARSCSKHNWYKPNCWRI